MSIRRGRVPVVFLLAAFFTAADGGLTAAGSTVVTVRYRKAESDAVAAVAPEGGGRGYEQ
jgi:hypothetical protein